MNQNKLLAGVKVLDFSRMVAGPMCTVMLADIGAEVIKVEPPQGDDTRYIYPFVEGQGSLFLMLNRNKKSLALDLKNEKDLEIVRRLVMEVDVVVENFRPGVTKRLGIDYESMKSLNPKIVYASISGFGQTGPLSHRPSYDLIAQGMTGLMSVTGDPQGSPTQLSESFSDMSSGLYASWAICAALLGRDRSGEGCHIDIALFDCLFSLMTTSISQALYSGENPQRVGNRHPASTPFGVFEAQDGDVIIAVANDQLFVRLAEAMGSPDLAIDPRFLTDHKRTEHEPILRDIIEQWTTTMTVNRIVEELDNSGVPCCPIQTVQEAINSEYVASRGIFRSTQSKASEPMKVPVQPVKFSCSLQGDPLPAPRLGEHNDQFCKSPDETSCIG